MIVNQVQRSIAKTVKQTTGLDLKPEDILIEHPENEEFGDYSSNIAMAIFSKLKIRNKKPKTQIKNQKISKFKNPKQLAELIKKQLLITHYSLPVDSIRIDGLGFLNFKIKTSYFLTELQKSIEKGDKYGQSSSLKNKKIMVEYAHPNTHKQFHIGHLRNITNGEAIVRILEAQGAKIIKANYQGDVGLHIAKCLWSLCKLRVFTSKLTGKDQYVNTRSLHQKIEFLAKAYVKGNTAYEKDEKAKKEILEINKKIYNQSDPRINKLWKQTRQWSLNYFDRIYKRVYTHFDRLYFEGEVAEKGKEIVLAGLKKGIFKRSKGAIIFQGSKYGLHDRVFITSEGNPTYEAKDMALGPLQFKEYNPDLIIHNVGPEQAGYFKVVFEALAQTFPYTKDRELHIIPGWVKLKEGKMASRFGNVVLGEWLLDEAKKRIKKSFPKVNEETAEMIAVGAVKYSFLKVSPSTEVAFDFDDSISLQGNSGPYLQYTYARCKSVLKKANLQKGPTFNTKPEGKVEPLQKEELSILRHFYKFPEIVQQAGESYSPNLICNFLYDLAQKYNTFYNKHRIINPTMRQYSNITMFRICLTAAVRQILKNGLYLLGIKCPEKM